MHPSFQSQHVQGHSMPPVPDQQQLLLQQQQFMSQTAQQHLPQQHRQQLQQPMQSGFFLQQQMTFPTSTPCGMMSSVAPTHLTGLYDVRIKLSIGNALSCNLGPTAVFTQQQTPLPGGFPCSFTSQQQGYFPSS